MDRLQRIMLQKRTWCCMIALELLILAALVLLYHGRERVELNFTQDDLVDDTGAEGFYVDGSYETRYVATPRFTLPKGMYTLEIQYESAGDAKVRVVHPGSRYHSEVSGDIPLPENNTVSCDFRVSYADRPVQVRGMLSDDGQEGAYILLRNVRISYADCALRNYLFRAALFLLAADGLFYIFLKKRQGGRVFGALSDQIPCRELVLLIFICSIPLMVDYLFLNSHDLYFHLMRIEGIRAGLEDGMFPVRIQPGWLAGHGYAASLFYGDLFLYFPAILRYFGVSVQAAYKCYVVMINLLTVCISYYSFSRMSRPKIGLACTVLYSLNIYRLTCIYTRAAVGEYTAMTFMPLVLYGLWKLYTLPEDTKRHKDSWITITAGCTGIFLSHMISTQIAAFFIVLSAVFMWKRIFRKRTLLVLVKAVLSTILLNVWFLVPFMDYMASGTYVINNADKYASYQIEKTGAFAAQFLMSTYEIFGHSLDAAEGIVSEMPLTVGIASMTVLAGWFLLCLCRKERGGEEKKTEFLAVFLGVVSLWMATCLFPYTWLVDRLPVLRLPIVSIQYLWRFLSAAAVLLAWLFCLILRKEWIPSDRRRLFMGVVIGLSLWQGMSYMGQCLQNAQPYRVYQAGNMSTMKAQSASAEEQESVMGGEYLPLDRDEPFFLSDYVAAYVDRLTYDETCVNVEEWGRERGAVTVSLQNRTNEVQQVEVPLLCYKGYRAVTDDGNRLEILPGTSHRISVIIPAEFAGRIRVEFREPWYWRVCELISLIVFLCVVLYRIRFSGKNRINLHFGIDS